MTKHDQYHLIFFRANISNGNTRRFMGSSIDNNPYDVLTFINVLHQTEIQYFIESISIANNGGVYDPNFYLQNGTEPFSIQFDDPNFIIEGITINMLDLQQLLTEWVNYLNS
jgi:hypothetical protein